MEEQKSKIEGWRKMSVAMGTIAALTARPPTNLKIAIIIGVVAVFGIICQTILDWRKK